MNTRNDDRRPVTSRPAARPAAVSDTFVGTVGRANGVILPFPRAAAPSPFVPLLPVVAAADDVSPEVDQLLTAAARLARDGEVSARNLLYSALEPKVARFVTRYKYGGWADGRFWDVEDVAQEAFIVFADLIATWTGGASFAAYFLALFPRRLSDAVRRFDGSQTRRTRSDESDEIDTFRDAAVVETDALLRSLAAALDPIDARILLWRVRDQARFAEIASRLGLTRRTVYRRWQALRVELRQTLGQS